MNESELAKKYGYPIVTLGEETRKVFLVDNENRIWGTQLFKRWPRKLKKFRKKHDLTLEIPMKGFDISIFNFNQK